MKLPKLIVVPMTKKTGRSFRLQRTAKSRAVGAGTRSACKRVRAITEIEIPIASYCLVVPMFRLPLGETQAAEILPDPPYSMRIQELQSAEC